MPDNHAPYIADDTMRHYDELSQLGNRYHDGDKAVGAVTQYGNQAWGAGNNSAHGDYARSMSMGGVGGGITGLLHEALRKKTEQEKNQTMGRKFMRYAGKGGLGALAGAGAGSLYQAAMHKVAVDPRMPAEGIGGTQPSLNERYTSIANDYKNDMQNMGRSIERGSNAVNAAAPHVGSAIGGAVAGNPGRLAGGVAGSLFGQQARHAGADTNVFFGGRSPTQPIPMGLQGGKITNQPTPKAVESFKQMQNNYKTFLPQKAAASEWKGVDLAKNPINWSRTLPKADASAKNWQGAQPGTPAPQVPMTGQQPAAAPPMVPVNQAPPMVPVGTTKTSSGEKLRVMQDVENEASKLQRKGNLKHVANNRKNDTYSGNFGRGVTAQHVSRLANQAMQQLGDQMDKTSQLRDFGAKVAAFNIGDFAKNIPAGLQKVMPAAGAGALGGAALGGLHGLVSPGHEDIYDDEGNVVGRQRRGRFGAALRGALGGGAAGGLAGAGMSAFAPKQTAQIGDWLKGQYTKGREAIDPRFARQNAVNRVNAGNPAATAAADEAAGEEWKPSAPSPVMSEAEGRMQQQLGQESAVANAQKQLGIR
jgi:hypothetical protein